MISRILDTVGELYGRVLPSGRFYATFTDVYVEDLAHFGHHRKTLRTFTAVRTILRDVYGRLRGGFRAYWTP